MKEKMAAAQSSGGPSMGDAAPLRDSGRSCHTAAAASQVSCQRGTKNDAATC